MLDAQGRINVRSTFGEFLLIDDTYNVGVPLDREGKTCVPLTPGASYTLRPKNTLSMALRSFNNEQAVHELSERVERMALEVEKLHGQIEAVSRDKVSQTFIRKFTDI